jgi:signal transduction histidine kinase
MSSEDRSLGAGPESVNAGGFWKELALLIGSVAADASAAESPGRLAGFAVSHLGAARAIVFGRKQDPDGFTILGSAGLDTATERALLLEYSRRLASWITKTREPLVVGRPQSDTRFESPPSDLVTAFALPLKCEAEVLGAFIVLDASPGSPDSGTDRELLLLCLAHLAAMCVDRGRARARWRDAAQDLEQSEQRLIGLERLAAAGEMSAEVGCEVKESLQGLGSLADQIMCSLDVDDPRRSILERMMEETARLGRAISGAGELARPGPVLEPDTLNRIMSETLALVRDDVEAARVQLTQRLGASLPPLLLDADVMRRVFLNLVRAGVRSAAKGGRVKVETKRRGDVIEVLVAADGERRSGQALDALWSTFGSEDDGGNLHYSLSRHLLLDRGISLRAGTSREWPFCLTLVVPIAGNQDRRRGKRERRRSSDA